MLNSIRRHRIPPDARRPCTVHRGSRSLLASAQPKVIYTPGVKYLVEKAKAYWLIDAIASYFGSPEMNAAQQQDYRLREMQF